MFISCTLGSLVDSNWIFFDTQMRIKRFFLKFLQFALLCQLEVFGQFYFFFLVFCCCPVKSKHSPSTWTEAPINYDSLQKLSIRLTTNGVAVPH